MNLLSSLGLPVAAVRVCGLMMFFVAALIFPAPLRADLMTDVRGVVHDPKHRPLEGAEATLNAVASSFRATAKSNEEGLFEWSAVPLGEYTVTVELAGFMVQSQRLTIASGTSPLLHFALVVGTVQQSVNVTASMDTVETVTPTTLVSRNDIGLTPGADRVHSMQMITDYVPGAYMTHDMLHMRGGHQVSWLLDGVQIPNTNIASNVGPQIDPNDIDYLEAQRGSYAAENGDRTFGVFNVAPRNGFERDRQGELLLTAGNLASGQSELSLGDHTDRFAWYTSLNGNRSSYGLAPPVVRAIHDSSNGYGGFASLIYNRSARDQFRMITQARYDYFQIPYDPDPNSAENRSYQSAYLRDSQHESDALSAFTWVRTFSSATVVEVSPFYHYNRANYRPSVLDLPVATISQRGSNYGGLQASVSRSMAHNAVQAGLYGWGQRDHYLFGATFNDQSFEAFRKVDASAGGLVEAFVSDSFKVAPWLTLMAGVRESHFSAQVSDNAVSPRVGVALQIPRLGWVLRGFYGRFYQPPPLLSGHGPIVQYAQANSTAIIPLHGERDEEHQFGVQIPFRGWSLDADNFRTRAKNFLDHSNIGESSIYFPVTVDGALIRGWELSLRSPRLWRYGQAHLAYANQVAEQRGGITGGLICAPIGSPQCAAGFSYRPVDHDQRNTLDGGFNATLPARMTAAVNLSYGSGFTNGSPNDQYPRPYLPSHSSLDLSLGKRLGESTSVTVTALNTTGHRVLLDNSLTFGGFHYNDPRQIYAEVRYRFHF